MIPSHLRHLVVASVLACVGSVPAWAQDGAFPSRQPIEIVVPFPPGGSVDPIARALQVGMRQPLGATLVVANQPGAGGTLGTARVARAPADGYLLGLTTVGPLTTQPHMTKLTYGVDSFEYVCRTHVTPQVLVVPGNSPFRTLAEFVAFARDNPGKVVMSSTGIGSLPHLAAVEFGQLAGFEWLHVPTKGDSDAAQLALAGEITAWVAGAQTYAQLGPRLRALGILEPERSSAMPDVPTFTEQGYRLLSAGWGGLIAPKGTPGAVVARLAQACAEATRSPEFGQMLQTLKVPQGHLGPDEFAAFVKAESERYGRLIRSVGGAAQVRTN
jgi:tripartite-type tricarboxylate transporter receptor subunit TctC